MQRYIFAKNFSIKSSKEKKDHKNDASCGYESEAKKKRERKKLVDYRPLFSATIGYETGRRKLPLRFQISIIKLDGIVHRRNRKTMNLRHILSLSRVRKNNETFLDTLACPFRVEFQNVFRYFQNFSESTVRKKI